MHASRNKVHYRNSMPLQPSSQRLVSNARKEMHILRQKKALHQTPSNFSALTLRPSSDVGCHRKGLITEPESGLPTYLRARRRRDVRPNLCSRPNTQGGVLKGVSLRPAGGCLTMRRLFQEQPRGGGEGVGFLPWGSCVALLDKHWTQSDQ